VKEQVMAFDVYPDLQLEPLEVVAGIPSGLTAITERAAGDPALMFIRVVKLGAECAGSGPPHPTIRLQAGTGAAVDLPTSGTVVPIFEADEQVANASIKRIEAGGVYLIRVRVIRRELRWKIQFVNNGPEVVAGFTWVVADDEGQTLQPWINIPETLEFTVFTEEAQTLPFRVANLGPGRLELEDLPDDLGTGFALTGMQKAVDPNDCRDVQVTFTGPATPVVRELLLTVESNDTTARPMSKKHNQRIRLKATTRPRPPTLVGLPPGTIITIERNMADAIELFQIHPGTGVRDRLDFTAGLLRPRAVTVARDGSLLVAGRRPFQDVGAIVRVNPTTGQQADVATAGMLVKPAGLVEDGDTILVVEEDGLDGNGGVIEVNPATGGQTQLADGGGVFRKPVAIAVGAGGTILVLARIIGGGYGLFRIHPETGVPTALSDLPSRDTFGLAVEESGMVIVGQHLQGAGGGFTFSEGSVIRVKPVPGGQQSHVTSSGSLHVVGLAVEHDRHILVADDGGSGGGGVVRVNPENGDRTMLSASANPFRGPHAIAVVPGRT
jgi:hypothetical protein